MIEQYKEINHNVEYSLTAGYDFERFKGMPFPSDLLDIGHNSKYQQLIWDITDQIRRLSRNVTKVIENIQSKDYSIDVVMMKNITQEFKRTRPDYKYATIFSNNFSQLALMAESVGVEPQDLKEKLNILCKKNIAQFSFMEDMAKFIAEYVQIEPYLNMAEYDQDELDIYKDELDDLTNRFSTTISQAPKYLDFDLTIVNEQHIGEFNDIKKELSARITEKDPTIQLNISELYQRDISAHSGDLATFMLDKNYEDTIKNRITLTQSQEIQDYITFEDGSVCYKKDGTYNAIKNKEDLRDIFSQLEYSMIDYQLRKKPKIAKYIAQLYTDSGYNHKPTGQLENVLIVIDTYLKNEQILKNMKLDLTVFKEKNFEEIDDYMNALVGKHKLNQYANSILSNKTKHLLSENSLESFKVLMDSGVSKGVIQNLIGKKLAAINTQEEFELYLNKVVDHISGFSQDILMDKLNTNNIKAIYDEKNVVVFEVDTFEQSQALGSPSWCISRSNYYFNDYKKNGNHQYFLYDFNRTEKDNQSMIGFTVQPDGSMRTQHSKNDDYHSVDAFLQKIVNKILYTEQERYQLSDSLVSELNQEFNPKTKKNLKKGKTL